MFSLRNLPTGDAFYHSWLNQKQNKWFKGPAKEHSEHKNRNLLLFPVHRGSHLDVMVLQVMETLLDHFLIAQISHWGVWSLFTLFKFVITYVGWPLSFHTGLLFTLSGRTDAFVRFSNLLTVSGFLYAHFVIEVVVAYLMVQNSVKKKVKILRRWALDLSALWAVKPTLFHHVSLFP